MGPGRRREMGLGSARDVPLARARELVAECRGIVAAGRDPLEARAVAKAAESAIPTFGECADEFIAAKQSEWRNDKASRAMGDDADEVCRAAAKIAGRHYRHGGEPLGS